MPESQLRSKTVGPLPISGSSAPELNSINHTINTLNIQSAENAKFDTKEPMNIPSTVQGFCTSNLSSSIAVIGGLLIVYGCIA